MNQEQSKTSGTVYEIRIQERLDERWADWFEGMTVHRSDGVHQTDGATVLRGPVADQAAYTGC